MEVSIRDDSFVNQMQSLCQSQSMKATARQWKRRHVALSHQQATKMLALRDAGRKPIDKRRVCNEAERCVCAGTGALVRRIERRLTSATQRLLRDPYMKAKVLGGFVFVHLRANTVEGKEAEAPSGISGSGASHSDGAGAADEQPPAPVTPVLLPRCVIAHLALQYLSPFRGTFTRVTRVTTVKPQTSDGVMLQALNSPMAWRTIWELVSTLDRKFVWDLSFWELYESDTPLGREVDVAIVEVGLISDHGERVWRGDGQELPSAVKRRRRPSSREPARRRRRRDARQDDVGGEESVGGEGHSSKPAEEAHSSKLAEEDADEGGEEEEEGWWSRSSDDEDPGCGPGQCETNYNHSIIGPHVPALANHHNGFVYRDPQ